MLRKTGVCLLITTLLAGCMNERIAEEHLLTCEQMFGPEKCAESQRLHEEALQ
jgi:hypothetical protein